MPFVRFLYGWHGECWLEWGVEGIGCAVVLGAGGLRAAPLPRGGLPHTAAAWDLVSGIPHPPLPRGIGLCHSPPSAVAGDWGSAIPHPPLLRGDLASGIPHPPRRRGPCNNWKKSSQSARWRPVFFCTHPFAYKSKLLTLGLSTKKALKRCLRAFFRCCGERGIRTPGTVTRTSV